MISFHLIPSSHHVSVWVQVPQCARATSNVLLADAQSVSSKSTPVFGFGCSG